MNCQDFNQQLDEFLAGVLSAGATDAASAHLQSCVSCQRRLAHWHALRAALRSEPVPSPRPGFFEGALRRARRPSRLVRWSRVAAGAMAASLALWVGLNGMPGDVPATSSRAAVTIVLHETHTVQLAFNAEQTIAGAMLRIQLPKGIELQGFPGQSEIVWRTDLASGVNLLALPLTAVAMAEGSLRARLEHDGRSTELLVALRVNDMRRTEWRAPNNVKDGKGVLTVGV